MGGGDLNLKKSWHPSTLRNIERVWKAEQKHEAEQQKIEQLQKELAEERAREEIQTYAEDQGVIKKKEEKLDWMYQGPAAMVNRDEYLLGRKIDKTFETLQQLESGKAPEEDTKDVTMFSSQNLSGNVTVDLANKIREDPLFNIMKKEKEQRKNLLTNPVKMKQLQQMLKASLAEKAHKKNKKSKKKKKQMENDSEDESPQKKRKHKKHNDTDSEEEDSRNLKKASKLKHYQNLPDKHDSSKYNGHSSDRRHHSPDFSSHLNEYSSRSSYKDSHSYKSNHKDYDTKSSYDDDKYSQRRNRDYVSEHNGKHSVHQRTEKRSNDQTNKYKSWKDSSYQDSRSSNSSSKKKIDSQERDRLLKEMQENAKWREEQRKRNTTRYKEEDEKEDNVKKVDSSDFLKPMLSKAAGKGSLENRVKQKIFSIQRSSSAMDKNFARRD